jgi:hypothetical protein
MIDDLLGELFGEAVFGRLGRSRPAQLLARLFFDPSGHSWGSPVLCISLSADASLRTP